MVTLTEEQHDAIKELLGRYYSSIYQVSPWNEDQPKKVGTVYVRIFLPPTRDWYECSVETNGRVV